MMSLLNDLEDLKTAALAAFSAAKDPVALENVRVEYLGTRGKLKAIKGRMGEVSKEEKPAVGKKMNEIGVEIEAAFEAARVRVESSASAAPASDSSSLEILRQERLNKLNAYEAKMGKGSAWGSRFPERTSGKSITPIDEIRKKFLPLQPGETVGDDAKSFGTVVLAARILLRRDQSKKLIFLTVQDQAGTIQVALWNNKLNEETLALLRDTLDLWDIVGIEGELRYTQKGEPTVWATSARILCKCVAPPPDKHHGIHDKEIRYRQRYLDLITTPESRSTFILRSKAVAGVRRFLDAQGFLEMETPVLQTIPGGAAARPFETKLNALDMKMYMRIATEIGLKKVMVGGLEKVYEMGRLFRNEGIDATHNPEFTTVEIYQAYADLRDMMALVENLVSHLAESLTGSTTVKWRGKPVKLGAPWPRLDYCALLKTHAGVESDDVAGLDRKLLDKKIDPAGMSHVDKIDKVFGEYAEPHLWDACFIINQPVEMSPLCRAHPDNPKRADRFEAFAVCTEISNAYTELNDPIEQRKRFVDQMLGYLRDDAAALGKYIEMAEKNIGMMPQKELRAVRDLLNAAIKLEADFGDHHSQVVLPDATESFFVEIRNSEIPRQRELIKIKERLTDPSLMIDEDFLCAMEHGMPPAGGMGIGIDRVVMLLAGADSLRDVILFPLMRPE
jgi:lysyl-tRNA synthetase class 2